ncbi:MAG TPA: crossover junction endodeoxyribonuclease RuvC [Patescibacteria group bacterium]|nr:crossover junction endodeoxyribonuclease RuvC [Patescibacteria group bacterium]
MIIMGVDPGFARVGWAIIEHKASRITPKAYGCIETEKTETLPNRLMITHNAIQTLIKRFSPDCMSVEELYFATNAKTAISVGQARGVILLAAAQKNIPVVSYSPLTIKRTICGDGKADKSQIGRMVTKILKLKEIPKPDDTADALAIALTHGYSFRLTDKFI